MGAYLRPGYWVIDPKTHKKVRWVAPVQVEFMKEKKSGVGSGRQHDWFPLVLTEKIEAKKLKSNL